GCRAGERFGVGPCTSVGGLRAELVLLPARVEGREWVLPLPDEECPEERKDPGRRQDRAEDADPASHVHPPNARRDDSVARLRAWAPRTSLRMTRRPGPRRERSPTSGYGAYRPAPIA